MSQYYVQPTLRDTSVEPRYTFAEVKWGKIVAIHHHWVPLDEFCKFFEANAFFVDITDVLIDGEPPAIGDSVTNDPNEGYKIIHIRNTYTEEEQKQYVIDMLKMTRDQKELEVIEYKGVLFDADTISQTRMEKARTFLEDNDISSIIWTTAVNTRVDLTVQDFKNINTLIAIRSNDLHIRYNQLKQFILNLDINSSINLNDIDWNYPIPTEINGSEILEFEEPEDNNEKLEEIEDDNNEYNTENIETEAIEDNNEENNVESEDNKNSEDNNEEKENNEDYLKESFEIEG